MYEHCHKYPSTPVLPHSPGSRGNEEFDTSLFIGKEVVVTEKMDGENCNMLSQHIHARSIDGRHHPSRDWVKQLHARIRFDIPDGWRLCGENLYAEHSIKYDTLESYFYLFSVWNEKNEALDWDSTLEWAEMLGLVVVPTLYRGIWDEDLIRNLRVDVETSEGYVVRTVEGFHYNDFTKHIAKFVRPNHVSTDEHWMHGPIIENKLKEK